MTVKRISNHCDDFAKVCITEKETDTVIRIIEKTEIEYRDTIVYVNVPGKTVIKEVPVYIENGIVNSELSILSVPFAISYAQVVSSKLNHELVQTDTTLRIRLENALRYSKTLEKQNKVLKEKYVVTVKENSNWAKFCVKVVWVLIVVIVLGTGYLIFRFRSKLLGIPK